LEIVIDEDELKMALDKKMRNIATNLVEELKDITRERDIVATGLYVKSFHTKKAGDSVYDIWNDTPYSKIVEWGAEPHTPPFDAILKWVVIKKKEEGREAVTSAWKIVKHIEKYGLEPNFVFTDAIVRLKRRMGL